MKKDNRMDITTLLGKSPPQAYVAFLNAHARCESVGDILLYGTQDIVERNETYEVPRYCPGYATIGDDGGGRAIMLNLSDGSLFIVGHGAIMPDYLESIANDFTTWYQQGCPLPMGDDYE
jgi:hypothetical protein